MSTPAIHLNVPLRHRISHSVWESDSFDTHGNAIPNYLAGVDVPCLWYIPSRGDRSGGESPGGRAQIDCVAYIPDTVKVSPRDRFTVSGFVFEMIGLPGDYNHGPYLYPGLLVIELHRIEDLG